MGRSVQHEMRSVAQPAAWSMCMDLIEQAESVRRRYDWVVRARPDAFWFHPHPPVCAMHPGRMYVHVWNDHHFVLPRAIAPIVMRGMLQAYTSCEGRFLHETPERWLQAALANATRGVWSPCSGHGSAPTWSQLVFPLVLVRRSAREPDAWLFCAQNAIVPYALGNASTNPCRQRSEQLLRRLQSALVDCARSAYPGEAIDSSYHRAHVLLTLRNRTSCPDWLRRSVSPEPSQAPTAIRLRAPPRPPPPPTWPTHLPPPSPSPALVAPHRRNRHQRFRHRPPSAPMPLFVPPPAIAHEPPPSPCPPRPACLPPPHDPPPTPSPAATAPTSRRSKRQRLRHRPPMKPPMLASPPPPSHVPPQKPTATPPPPHRETMVQRLMRALRLWDVLLWDVLRVAIPSFNTWW